jgi:flagellar hook-associated protein 3 FlgL
MARVTFPQVNDIVMRQLNNNQTRMAKLQEQLSSGKALLRPSDAPIDVVNDLELRNNLSYRTQNKRNTDNGGTYLTVLDSTMMSFDNLFQHTRELALQGANDTLLPRDRQYVNNEVRQQLLQMVNLGNSSYKGEYMFSGTDTDKVPFSVNTGAMNINTVANEVPAGGAAADTTDDAFVLNTPMHIWDRNITDSADSLYGNPSTKRLIPGSVTVSSLVEGTDYRVDYVKGDITFLTPAAQAEATAGTLNIQFDWIRRNELLNTNGDVKREIEPGILMEINIKADGAFGQETDLDSFSAMITLMQGLHTSTQSEIESSITNLDVAMNRMLGQQATVGSRTNRMESTADRNDGNIINSTELLSRIEDLDFAKAISDFTMASTVYQASLKSASKILTPSLMDYM